jgi:hypothetical protein
LVGDPRRRRFVETKDGIRSAEQDGDARMG